MSSEPHAANSGSTYRVARVYARLRTAHLERFERSRPADVMYLARRYDYDATKEDPNNPPEQVSLLRLIWRLLRVKYDVVEVMEPAVVSYWPHLICQVWAIRAQDALRRRHTRIVTYCIGIADPAEELAARLHLRPGLAALATGRMMRILMHSMDRCAFGTSGSLELYRSYSSAAVGKRGRLFEALPAPCQCVRAQDSHRDSRRMRRSVIFVGAFRRHKGVDLLIKAWSELDGWSVPDRPILTLVGKGDLAGDIQCWASDRSDVEVHLDPPRDEIHRLLREASVLVLLSQRWGYWREQIGLPILEGLSHGCEIVSTTETGLARWLQEHGHSVLRADADSATIARAILDALDRSAGRRGSLAELPDEDMRITADEWLFARCDAAAK